MTNKSQEINWQPLSRLSLVAHLIDEGVKDSENQLSLLKEGRNKPYLYDDALINRIKNLYSEKLEFVDIYLEQLTRWKNEELEQEQSSEITRLTGQLQKIKELCKTILALAEEIEKSTIDKIMDMDEAELGLRALMGEFK